jgi:hypothetical protein
MRKLAFKNTTRRTSISGVSFFVTNALTGQQIILFCEPTGHILDLAEVPDALHLLQQAIPRQPSLLGFTLCQALLAFTHPVGGKYFAKHPCFWMHIELASRVKTRLLHRNHVTTPSAEDADLPLVHESIPLHELQQVGLDMRTDGTIRLDHRTGLGIDIVPKPPDLRAQPAFQRSQQICEPLALGVGTPHPFALREQLFWQIGAPSVFRRSRIPSWPFDYDLMHVSSHRIGCGISRVIGLF